MWSSWLQINMLYVCPEHVVWRRLSAKGKMCTVNCGNAIIILLYEFIILWYRCICYRKISPVVRWYGCPQQHLPTCVTGQHADSGIRASIRTCMQCHVPCATNASRQTGVAASRLEHRKTMPIFITPVSQTTATLPLNHTKKDTFLDYSSLKCWFKWCVCS